MAETILAFGEVLWDLLPSGEQLGGAPLNLAYRLANLGRKPVMVSRLGRDARGRAAVERMEQLGLDLTHVQRDDARPTGTVRVTLDAGGAPDYTIAPDVAWDYIAATDELLAAAGGATCVCYGTLARRNAVSRATCDRVLDAATLAVKFLDVNLRRDGYTAEAARDALHRAHLVKFNADELIALSEMFDLTGEDLTERTRKLNDAFDLFATVVTQGADGALTVPRGGEPLPVAAHDVTVVDTVGAGDAFAAGFIHKYLVGASLADCTRYGNAMGALVAAQSGATGALTAGDVDAFLAPAPPEPKPQKTQADAAANTQPKGKTRRKTSGRKKTGRQKAGRKKASRKSTKRKSTSKRAS
ncbi:MAG: carbohydrate kinase [Phycisphaerae bacterium]|nr:carbohydrate kinase [Phycisphaerae bacterium]